MPAAQPVQQQVSNVYTQQVANQSGGVVNGSFQQQVSNVPPQHLVRNPVSHFNAGNQVALPQFQTPATSKYSTAGNSKFLRLNLHILKTIKNH